MRNVWFRKATWEVEQEKLVINTLTRNKNHAIM